MKTKNIYSAVIFFVITACILPSISFSQVKWQKDIFGQNVFVENKGQFDDWAKTSVPIKFAVNNSDKIFFTQQGLTFKLVKAEEMDEEEREEMARNGVEKLIDTYHVNMQWEGCNTNSVLEVSEESDGYYTFGEKGFENIKAKGFRKLVYKELYQGIDVEYIVDEKGGIKYSLIVRPGSDVSKVKMKYTGDVDKMEISTDGNILIKTPIGDITDHTPLSFYKETSEKINSAFELEGNTVSFNLRTPNPQLQTIIIDPWTITPTSLTTNNAAFDVDYDVNGNVYVSGGTGPFKLSKYTNSGTFLWTFTNPATWGMYTKFCLLRNSGTVFIGQGFSSLTTTSVMKISTGGTLQFTSAAFTGSCEIWRMFYNRCTGQLIGFGGGIFNPNNLQLIADTNLISSTALNFNGYGNPTDCCNDITSVDMDDNGDFFALMSSYTGLPIVNNRLMKSLTSAGYNPPPFFDVVTGYNFEEGNNNGIPGFAGQTTVRSNAVSVNSSYVYSYDGRTLIAWNKTTGAMLGSVIVNGGYAGGKNRTHEGIDVDECNTVYVGGINQVHVFSFNGTTFTPSASITTNIPNEVYDICLGQMNKLYVCGAGFVTELLLTSAICNTINLTISATSSSCSAATGSATVTATGGTSPYTYLWNPTGQTTSTATGLAPGTYTVIVTDGSASCNPNGNVQTATVTVTSTGSITATAGPNSTICAGQTATLNSSGGTNYSWSNGNTSSVIIISPSATITYSVIVSTGSCADTAFATVVVSPLPIASASNSTICAGQTATLNSSGGTNYLWNTGATTSSITSTLTSTSTFTVVVSNGNCADTAFATVTVNATPSVSVSGNTVLCIGDTATLTASGSTNYLWNTGSTATMINVSPSTTTTYTVTTANGTCTSTTSITVTVSPPPVAVGNNTTICAGQNATLTASGGATYSWSNGSTSNPILVSPASSTTYSVIVSVGSCSDTASATVVVNPNPTATAWSNVTITQGQSTTLSASGGGVYIWSNGATGSNISVAPLITTWYCVTVSNNNCTDTACVTVYVEPIDCSYADDRLFVPDAFSPNGDTKNDYFGVYYPNISCIKEFKFIIYDRWGEKVFEAEEMSVLWDGTYKGKLMNTAVFVYYMKVIFIDEKEVVRKGNISLIR